MKKEIVFVIAVALFLFAYILDYFAGPINLVVKSPLVFLDLKFFNLYPMTFVAVAVRTTALIISVSLVLSLIDKQYFQKIIISLFLTFVAEIYAFQQLATGAKITPVLWTLAISYAGAGLIIPIIFYIFASITHLLIPQPKNVTHLSEPQDNSSKPSSSVLNP